ncbi:MAG TPA: helix-turn-helix transcriptional regulator [Chloroflexota bacterium]|nr:helix-turn-helix transcriptional regulator [Chloroflexota bacterium]
MPIQGAHSGGAFTDVQLELIRESMRAVGMRDQVELARALKASAGTITGWFSKRRGASDGMKRRLVEVLNISLAQLADPEGYAALVAKHAEAAATAPVSEDVRANIRKMVREALHLDAENVVETAAAKALGSDDSDTGADRLTREEVERMMEERFARQDQIQRGERAPVIAQAADGTVLTPRKPPEDAPQKTVRLLSPLAAGPADDVDYLAQAEGEIELPPDVARVVSDEAVAYRVRGNSLSGLRIYDGMVVVAEPIDVRDGAEGRGYRTGDVVLALAWSGSEPARMYVKQFRSTGPFPPGLWSVLPPAGKGSESEVLHEWEYRVVARVIRAYMPAFTPGG